MSFPPVKISIRKTKEIVTITIKTTAYISVNLLPPKPHDSFIYCLTYPSILVYQLKGTTELHMRYTKFTISGLIYI
jgi:hypothetical protein